MGGGHPLYLLYPLGWKSPALLCGAGRGWVPSMCSGKGEHFGNILGAKTAVVDVMAGHLLSISCLGCSQAGGSWSWGGNGGAKVHPTTAKSLACRVWRVRYRPGGALEPP